MSKTFKLERGGKQQFALLRQIPGIDKLLVAGDKVKYGSGSRWTVVEVKN